MKTRKRKHPSYRFTEIDRERIKAELRRPPGFREMVKEFSGKRRELADRMAPFRRRGLPYLGNDHRLVDEYDDRHTVVFPLRTDVDIRTVRKALDVLFPEPEGKRLKDTIIRYVNRGKAEQRNRDRWNKRFLGDDDLLNSLWATFRPGHLAGETLYRILTPDAESSRRWEEKMRRAMMKPAALRVFPNTAAAIVSELFLEDLKRTVPADALEKRFRLLPPL